MTTVACNPKKLNSQPVFRPGDKLLEPKQMRAVRELAEIEQHLTTFDQKYHLASGEFYARDEAGQQEDSADFMEWSSFYEVRRSVQQYLDWLCGDA